MAATRFTRLSAALAIAAGRMAAGGDPLAIAASLSR
jgi:hypothetical protein